jgi:hypothetical protein
MGLSRRQFTKEFKLAAVRRLEQGVSIGEAARALEVCQCRDKTPAILPTLPICAAVNLGGDAVGTLQ